MSTFQWWGSDQYTFESRVPPFNCRSSMFGMTQQEMAQRTLEAANQNDPRFTALVIRLAQRTGLSTSEVQARIAQLV